MSTGRRVVFVSATNGKTTTTKLLAAALRATQPVVTNASGANMPAGIVAALARPPVGVPADALAVLEADETFLPSLLPGTDKPLLVLGNLTRDQLDRVGEVAMVARRWRTVFAATVGLSAVANADDPHVVWAASVIPDVTWVSVGQRWTADSAVCPACGAILHRPSATDWVCTACGFRRPEVSWSIDPDGELVGADGVRYALDLQLPGAANRGERRDGRRRRRPARCRAGGLAAGDAHGCVRRWSLSNRVARWPSGAVVARKEPGWLVGDVRDARTRTGAGGDRDQRAGGRRQGPLVAVGRAVRAACRPRSHRDRRPAARPRRPADVRRGVAHDSGRPVGVGGLPFEAGLPGQPALDAVGTYTAFRELLRRGGGADDGG